MTWKSGSAFRRRGSPAALKADRPGPALFVGRRTPAAVPVLVLDGHTTQALACARSLGRAGYPVMVASERRWPLAGSSRFCRGVFRLRDRTPAAYHELRTWARHRGVRIALPLTETTCLLMNAEAGAWRESDIILGCGPDDMLREAFDKARALKRAAACGLAVPPARFPTQLPGYAAAAARLGFPCVVRSRFSSIWHHGEFLVDPGVAYITEPGELAAAVAPRRQGEHWPILQRWVGGRGKGVFLLCDRGRVVAWFAHERLRDVRPSGSGSSLRRSIPVDPGLVGPISRLIADLGWHGPAMLEFRDDGVNPPWLIEINGRFWGSLQLAVASGADLPVHWVRILSGERVEPSSDYRSGVTLRWLWGDVKRIAHILHGPPPGYPDRYPALGQGLRELLGRQPAGTRIETWDRTDPWPAVTEWVQGFGELAQRRNGARRQVAEGAPRP